MVCKTCNPPGTEEYYTYTLNWSYSDKQPVYVTYQQNNTGDTTLTLTGRGVVLWGEQIQENMLHLLENFASDIPPVNPTTGQTWFDTTNQIMMHWNGSKWIQFMIPFASNLPPSSLLIDIGTIWYNSTTYELYYWDGTTWQKFEIKEHADNAYVKTTGDSMTGNLHMINDSRVISNQNTVYLPAVNTNEVINKKQMDDAFTTLHGSVSDSIEEFRQQIINTKNHYLDEISNLVSSTDYVKHKLDTPPVGGNDHPAPMNGRKFNDTITIRDGVLEVNKVYWRNFKQIQSKLYCPANTVNGFVNRSIQFTDSYILPGTPSKDSTIAKYYGVKSVDKTYQMDLIATAQFTYGQTLATTQTINVLSFITMMLRAETGNSSITIAPNEFRKKYFVTDIQLSNLTSYYPAGTYTITATNYNTSTGDLTLNITPAPGNSLTGMNKAATIPLSFRFYPVLYVNPDNSVHNLIDTNSAAINCGW